MKPYPMLTGILGDTVNQSKRRKEKIKMALYIHIGCKLTCKAESNRLVDRWLHITPVAQSPGHHGDGVRAIGQ